MDLLGPMDMEADVPVENPLRVSNDDFEEA